MKKPWWLLLFVAFGVQAQTAWPERPITMIVPFPPGGVADTVARRWPRRWARELKQTVIVENRVGAGGALGMGMAARAPADGYHAADDAVVDLHPARSRQAPRPQARPTR